MTLIEIKPVYQVTQTVRNYTYVISNCATQAEANKIKRIFGGSIQIKEVK